MSNRQNSEFTSTLNMMRKSAPRLASVREESRRRTLVQLERLLNSDDFAELLGGPPLPGLEQVLDYCTELKNAFLSSPNLSRLAFLFERSSADFSTAFEAGLAGLNAVAFDSMRDVMEIEYLLRDFTHDPSRIEKWLSAKHRRDFAPAKLRKRHANAIGKNPKELSDHTNYSHHSEGLHVTPSFVLSDLAGKGRCRVPAETGVEFCLAEIFDHANRLLMAAHHLGKEVERKGWSLPDPRTLNAAAAAFGRSQGAIAVMLHREEKARRQRDKTETGKPPGADDAK